MAADHHRRLGDQARVARVGREPAPDVRLAGRSAEQLVVGRQHLQLPQRRDPELHAGALEVGPLDALLDDSAPLGELCRVTTEGGFGRFELHRLDRGPYRRFFPRTSRRGHRREVDQHVALTGHALVEFGDHLGDRWLALPHVGDCGHQVVDAAQILDAQRMRHPFFRKQAPTAALGSEREVPRIGAVHRNAEADRQVALQLGGVVGNHVGAVGVGDQRPQPLHQSGPTQQLERQRVRTAVEHREGRQPLAGVAGDHPRQQVQVVVDHGGQDRLGSDVDQPGPGLSQQQEQE